MGIEATIEPLVQFAIIRVEAAARDAASGIFQPVFDAHPVSRSCRLHSMSRA